MNSPSYKLSSRLENALNALPLFPGIRLLEIGCGPGVAAREIVRRMENARVLAIDRSAKAIELASRSSQKEIESGRLTFLQSKAEEFELPDGEQLYDIAFALRVGALDGRHPQLEKAALAHIAAALKSGGKLFIDGGSPLREIDPFL